MNRMMSLLHNLLFYHHGMLCIFKISDYCIDRHPRICLIDFSPCNPNYIAKLSYFYWRCCFMLVACKFHSDKTKNYYPQSVTTFFHLSQLTSKSVRSTCVCSTIMNSFWFWCHERFSLREWPHVNWRARVCRRPVSRRAPLSLDSTRALSRWSRAY